jgi:hypothetical protein
MPEFSPVPKPERKVKPKKGLRKARKPMTRKSATKRQPVAYEAAAIPKGERIRDPAHLDRVRSMICVAAPADMEHCGGWSLYQVQQSTPTEACHVTNQGWGGGDDETFPACPNHHRLLACSWHVAGRKRFEKMVGASMSKLAAVLYDETLALRGKGTP